ncbi:MAG: RNA polymerase sigma factor [Mariniblastus sp.]
MTRSPETRPSLIARLKDSDDQVAWDEFVQLYRPVVYRVALAKGMQAADAEDLAQTVLISVASAVGRWTPDPERARFRTWLNRIATNAIINSLSRGKPDRGSGDTGMQMMLSEQPCVGPDSDLIELEKRREGFRLAAKLIQNEFEDDTWQAFWLTAVENKSADSVALILGKKVGSIYTAKSRVMQRLQTRLGELTQ